MAKFLLISFLLIYQIRAKTFEIKQLSVGQNCGPTNIYDITAVYIVPWPPVIGQLGNIVMEGLFMTSTFVEEFMLGLCLNNAQ